MQYEIKLEKFRNNIDQIDDKILELIEERQEVILEIAKLKYNANKKIEQLARERILIDRIKNKSNKKFKDSNIMIFKYIIYISKQLQNQFINEFTK